MLSQPPPCCFFQCQTVTSYHSQDHYTNFINHHLVDRAIYPGTAPIVCTAVDDVTFSLLDDVTVMTVTLAPWVT